MTPSKTPPVVLGFAPSDPSGASGVQADLLTAASLGCHVLTVLTALLVQDTAEVEGAQLLAPDFIDDQARCLLEDMPVQALKVGGLYSPEAVSVVAQVAADYPDVPMVLHLGVDSIRASDDDSSDSTVLAQLELLVPQAHVVVVDHRRLDAWYAEGLLAKGDTENAVQALLALGPDHAFITDVPHAGGAPVNVLAGSGPQAEAWSWRRLPGSYRGAGSTLSAALTALLARGVPLRQAVIDAQQYTRRALEAGYQPGMGGILPNRLFWAGTSSDEEA